MDKQTAIKLVRDTFQNPFEKYRELFLRTKEALDDMVENEIKIKGDFTQALVQEISRPRIYAVNPDMTKTRMTGFQGRPAEQVAQVVLNTAKGNYRKTSGSDINVWDYYKLFGSAFP